MSIVLIIAAVLYIAIGIHTARRVHFRNAKMINDATSNKPVKLDKPKRPEIKLDEMLHVGTPGGTSKTTCAIHRLDRVKVCSCDYRDDWIKLRNDWIEYNEAMDEWKKLNGSTNAIVKTRSPYWAIAFWPGYLAKNYIEAPATKLPNRELIAEYEKLMAEQDKELES